MFLSRHLDHSAKPRSLRRRKSSVTSTIAAIQRYIDGHINETVERRNFRQRKQPGESFDDFLVALRDLVETCNFCSVACTQKNLRDQIIEGIIDGDTVEALLQEPDLTLAKAISKCQAQEAAKKQHVDIFHHHLESVAALRYNRGKSNAQTMTCPGCGAKPHPAGRSQCPAFNQTCFHCSKVGHFAKVCRSRQLDTPPNQQNSKPASLSNIRYVASTHPAPTIPIQIVSPNGSTTTPVLPDSGADISAAGVEILHLLHEHIDNIYRRRSYPKQQMEPGCILLGKFQSPFDLAPESILWTYTSIPTFTEPLCHGQWHNQHCIFTLPTLA